MNITPEEIVENNVLIAKFVGFIPIRPHLNDIFKYHNKDRINKYKS